MLASVFPEAYGFYLVVGGSEPGYYFPRPVSAPVVYEDYFVLLPDTGKYADNSFC